jgi:deazaflavin-dependent oxidoreductase (nitroreductase family)
MTAGSRRRPQGVRRALNRLPLGLYRVGLGGLLGRRFVLIHHLGRRSGQWRQVVVEVAELDQPTGAVTVMSGYGPGADWYRNLLADPSARIQMGKHSVRARAVPLTPDESGEVICRYGRRHPLAVRSLLRFLGLPVDGTDEAYRAAGHQIPGLRFEPCEIRPDRE